MKGFWKKLTGRRIPTILAILILFIGVAAGVFLITREESLSLFTKAGPTATPRQVEVVNIDSDTVTVVWLSDTPVSGFVKYGEGNQTNLTLSDDRDQLSGTTGLFTTHYVTIRGLKPGTEYSYLVGSGSQTYDNSGSPYKFKTPTRIATKPEEDTISGKVILQSGQPAPGVIVFVTLQGGSKRAALSRSSGLWTLPLATTRTEDLTQYLTYDRNATSYQITLNGGDLGTGTATANTGNDSPLGDLTLGTDTKLAATDPTVTTPITGESSLTVAPTSTPSAGIGGITSTTTTTTTSSNTVTVLTPVTDGEKIASSSPQIKIGGTSGLAVTSTIKPDNDIKDLIIGSNGSVSYRPIKVLSVGLKTLEVSYKESSGTTKKVTRTFEIIASETNSGGTGGLPSFSATPSASITPTKTPTPTPTPTLASSMPSTSAGIPVAGTVELTYALLSLGFVMVFSGVSWQLVLLKKSNKNYF